MQRINQVVTRTGDSGSTALIGGTRVPKHDLRVASYGDVDELNSCLGLARAHLSVEQEEALEILAAVQHKLFTVGCDLAAPFPTAVPRVGQADVDELESVMEGLMDELPPLEEFILPGGGPAGAALHLARTVARRAERATTALASVEEVNPLAVIYLNRLSDFLFVLARVVNRRQGQPETLADFSQRRERRAQKEPR